MKKSMFLIVILSMVGCSPQTPNPGNTSQVKHITQPGFANTSGGNGTSCDDIIIIQANNHLFGVEAEYEWLRLNYPGYQRIKQALIDCNDKPADVLTIRTKDGQTRDVYFDLSSFFGKL